VFDPSHTASSAYYSPNLVEGKFSELGFRVEVVASCSRPKGEHEGGFMADLQKNKQTVLAYYNMAFNERRSAEAAENTVVRTTSSTTPKLQTASRRSSVSWRASPSNSPR
jgi:hypothetical protein